MTEFKTPRDNYREAIGDFFRSMAIHRFLGIELTELEPGRAVCTIDRKPELLQQNGYFQAGVLVTLADSTAGAAGFTLLEENQNILSVNFAVSLMRSAESDRIFAEGRVIKTGQRLQFCRSELYREKDGARLLVMAADITMAVISESGKLF